MRVFFASGAKRVSLKSEGLTLLYYKNLDLCYARKYFVPPKTEHNIHMGSIFKHLAEVWKSAPVEFKEYFKNYAVLYNVQCRADKYPLNGYACFTKKMFEILKRNPKLDLVKLTWEDALFGIINRDIHDEQDGEAIINYQLLIINGIEEKKAVNGELLRVNLRREVINNNPVGEIIFERVEPE